jgi:hypothetical protein
MIRGVDHVVLVTLDLDEAMREHRGRGFLVQRGGEHPGGITHNALVGFADGSYLELLAFHDLMKAREAKHSWAPVADRGGGWADFALLSDDVVADAAQLGDLLTRPTEEGGRTRPDGVQISWRVARLRSPLPFLIDDVTPRDQRVPSGDATKHPNGVAGVSRVVLGARDVAALTDAYARLLERGAPAIEIRKADRDGVIDVVFGSR